MENLIAEALAKMKPSPYFKLSQAAGRRRSDPPTQITFFFFVRSMVVG
jgi:hypothetical protein